MKLKQLLITIFFIASSSAFAASTSHWDMNSSDGAGNTDLTFIRNGSNAEGTNGLDGKTMTGTVSETAEGLRFEGWWTASGTSTSCGEGSAFSGPVVLLFLNTSDIVYGDWGYCDENIAGMNPNKRAYKGSLVSGSLTETDTASDDEDTADNDDSDDQDTDNQLCIDDKVDDSNMPEVHASDLSIDIPKLVYLPSNGGNAVHLWAKLEFAGQNADGELLWKLADYDEVEEE